MSTSTKMFSQTVEYALRAVVCLAAQPDKPMKTHAISDLTHVPVDYLFKVLQSLARAGIVSASRGKHGGFVLETPADKLTCLAVVNAIDPMPRIRECPLDLPEHEHHLCALHRRIDAAMASVESAMASTTIAEIVADTGNQPPLFKLNSK